MDIAKAGIEHLSDVARLFDAYRQFYDCPADPDLALAFIRDRLEKADSDIFIALNEAHVSGFVQLYPSYCSVDAIKIYIVYDLYVETAHRQGGTGEKLMNRATQWARDNGAKRLDLLTARTNKPGQRLYEKLGYKKV
ncbi:MAG: GNAT family N-acetyltransferase, partial [Pseudomonadota bacterium]